MYGWVRRRQTTAAGRPACAKGQAETAAGPSRRTLTRLPGSSPCARPKLVLWGSNSTRWSPETKLRARTQRGEGKRVESHEKARRGQRRPPWGGGTPRDVREGVDAVEADAKAPNLCLLPLLLGIANARDADGRRQARRSAGRQGTLAVSTAGRRRRTFCSLRR